MNKEWSEMNKTLQLQIKRKSQVVRRKVSEYSTSYKRRSS